MADNKQPFHRQNNQRIELRLINTSDAASIVYNRDNGLKQAEVPEKDSRLLDSFDRSLKLAFELFNTGRAQEAEALCRVLMQIRPKSAQLLFLFGMVLHKAGRDVEAIKWFSLATQYQPNSARIYSGLGCAYQALKNHSQAIVAFEKAMGLEPPTASTCYNFGNSCYNLGRVDQAAALFRKAVELKPDDSASWNNLGKCLKELNHLDESVAAYDRALEIAPDYALARYGRAVSLLTAGRLLEGFREYESRQNPMKPRKFFQPEWIGENTPEKTLLIHAEQGFGDAIQMVRFIPEVRRRFARVILECRPEFASLFECSKCADEVVPYGTAIPAFDCFISLLSLPHVLNVALDTIPHKTPYLHAPDKELPPPVEPGQLKVGLVWAGNPNHNQDATRSIPLKDLSPIFQVPDVSFYSLQQNVPISDKPFLASQSKMRTDLKLGHFLDTASVINKLDLIIGVDTAVAHLAGALGKPVWMLVQHSPDWRWLLERTDTPWYPTMRLFRQPERGAWDLPIAHVAQELHQMTGGWRSETPVGLPLYQAEPILQSSGNIATSV